MIRFPTVFLMDVLVVWTAAAFSQRKATFDARIGGVCRRRWCCTPVPSTNTDDQSFSDLHNQTEDGKSEAFMKWMYHEKDCQGEMDAVQIRTSNHGRYYRGLYATRPVSRGEYLFVVPFESTILIEEEETTDVERGFKWLQIQMELQQKQHEWKPYLDVLPSRQQGMYFDATPDFWSNDQIQALEVPQVIDQVMRKKQSIQNMAQELGIDVEELQFATWLVNSRAVTVIDNPDSEDIDDQLTSEFLYGDCNDETNDSIEDVDDNDDKSSCIKTTCVLIPFLDMTNHSSENFNTILSVMSDRSNDDSDGLNVEEHLYYAVVANRFISKGEELLISYGSQEDTSLELLLHYGFVPDTNPYDVDFIEWSGICDEISNCWSTSLQEDEQKLATLKKEKVCNNSVEITTLRFRIRMKKAYNEYIDDNLRDSSSMSV